MMGADKDPNQYTSEAKSQFGQKNSTQERVKGVYPVGTIDLGKGSGEYLTHNQDIYKDKFNQR